MAQASIDNRTQLATVRDTVESIWIAIVLAFVLRAFFVEAFIIPTGSMAPRLMGEHWDLQCPNCGYVYAFGWMGSSSDIVQSPARDTPQTPSSAMCPNCSYAYDHAARSDGSPRKEFINAGDRVLVLKYLYNFSPPQPWDVVVFRNPQNNDQNFIKRLVGLPGESIELVHGDVFVKSRNTDGQWQIRRKPHETQQAMWQIVYDNDYQSSPVPSAKNWTDADDWKGSWGRSLSGRQFDFDGQAPAEIAFQAEREAFMPRYGYNSPFAEGERFNRSVDVCHDLKLEFVFLPRNTAAAVTMELSADDRRFRATLAANGRYSVESAPIDGSAPAVRWTLPDAATQAVSLTDGCRVTLEHADFRVILWVNDKAVFTSTDEQYRPDFEALKDKIRKVARLTAPELRAPQIRIVGERGPFALRHVLLARDVYYTSTGLDSESVRGPFGQYARQIGISSGSTGWGTMDNPIALKDYPEDPDLDSFFVLGDNSPQSLDGRLWTSAAPTLRLWKDPLKPHTAENALYQLGTVPRYNLIGKAFFVYWPAGFRVPMLNGITLVPNVGKMRLVR